MKCVAILLGLFVLVSCKPIDELGDAIESGLAEDDLKQTVDTGAMVRLPISNLINKWRGKLSTSTAKPATTAASGATTAASGATAATTMASTAASGASAATTMASTAASGASAATTMASTATTKAPASSG